MVQSLGRQSKSLFSFFFKNLRTPNLFYIKNPEFPYQKIRDNSSILALKTAIYCFSAGFSACFALSFSSLRCF
jgi:hypothetical protein